MTNIITKSVDKLKDISGLTGLKLQAASPDILLGIGIAAIGVGVVEACKATLKADDILEPAIEDVEDIKEDYQAEVIDKPTFTKELAKTYAMTGKDLLRLYAPAGLLLITGVACITKGQHILKKRNIALVAAYNTLSDAYDDYRDRVRSELGEDADKRFRNGTRKEDVIETVTVDENGKEHKKKVKNAEVVDRMPSPYSRFYAKGYTDAWSPSHDYNLSYIENQIDIMNGKLRQRGWITLNEVYEALGFEGSEAGMAVGWVLGNGDDRIICVPNDVYIAPDGVPVYNENTARFVNGYEPAILLDFNPDGVILDKLSTLGLAKI